MILKKTFCMLSAFMLTGMLVLTGCQNTETNINSENEIAVDTITEVSSEGTVSGEEVITPGEYEEKVFDRNLTKGKFALYVFRSDNGYVNDVLSQHSGDSMLIITPDGKTMLIDTNSPTNSSIIVDSLQKLGIKKLDYLVFTHQHLDHIGGYAIVFRYMKIGQVITNAHEYTGSNTYTDIHDLMERNEIPCTYMYEGDSMMLGKEVKIDFYNPPKDFDYTGGTEAQNNGSLLMKMTYKDASFLFGGDLYASQEKVILEKYADELNVDVAKMNHHGDATSNTKDWVKAVSPKICFAQMSAVINEIIVGRYQVQGATMLHPALDGPFVIYTDGDGTYDIQVSQERWVLDFGEINTEKGHLTVK